MNLDITARTAQETPSAAAPAKRIAFEPAFLRPMPARVKGAVARCKRLDGLWRLRPLGEVASGSVPEVNEGWKDFTVPGQWLQQGFDIPLDHTVGVATDFHIPASWRGNRLFLQFDAIHAGTEYWLNGQRLGYSENLFTPVQFDVTEAALPGKKNHLVLAMKVDTPSEKFSCSSTYAHHNLGGIDRSVWVFALPPVHIGSLHHETQLDGACRDATLSLDWRIENTTIAAVSGLSLRVSLWGPDGKKKALRGAGTRLEPLPPGETRGTWRIAVSNPLKWNAEQPNLYKMVVELHQGKTVVQKVERSAGFRKVEIRDRQLWINGTRVKLAGVCRHEIDPLTGRAATAVHAEEDVRLFKGANFNYIRTSHYPPTREFVDACDRLGMYVEVEAPFCWTRHGRDEADPDMVPRFLTPAAAMLEEFRDHPSVILWSLANESGTFPPLAPGEDFLAPYFAAMLELCRRLDPSRPVVFNDNWNQDAGACDIAVLHYPPFPPEGCDRVKNDPRAILLDEYFPPFRFGLTPGFISAENLNLNPGLEVFNWSRGQNCPDSEWSHIYASDRLIGGAIWAGIDEEFCFANGEVKGYGPWGFIDVWRRPKCSWWDAKRIHSPVWIAVRQLDYAPGRKSVRVPVENRYSFTDLSELQVKWKLGSRRGKCALKLPPQSRGEIEVPVPCAVPQGTLLVLRFLDAKGRLVNAHGITLGSAPVPPPPEPKAGCPEWKDDGRTIAVQGETFHFTMARATGEIRRERGNRAVPLLRFPTLFGSRQGRKSVQEPNGLPYAEYPDASTRVIDSVTVQRRDEALAIRVRDRYQGFEGFVEMLLDKEGQCAASFEYQCSDKTFYPNELGLVFLMDRKCREIRWRRQSGWDTYPEDHIGRPEGHAMATIGKEWGKVPRPPYRSRPRWGWRLDANEFGTRDFRAAKYNIYEASLVAPDGSGIRVDSDATANVRASLAPSGVKFHALLSNPAAGFAPGKPLSGCFSVRLLSRSRASRRSLR